MVKSDRDISAWDARLKEQLERSFHNYHNRRIDLSVARDNKQFDWTGEILIVEKASSADAIATVRLMFDDADPLTLAENVEIKSIFNRLYISNAAQADEWLNVIAGINFEYKKKIAEAVSGGGLTYVDRGSIATGQDFDEDDMNIRGAWTDLDLSGIVPAGVRLLKVGCALMEDAGKKAVRFRENGVTQVNIMDTHTQFANTPIEQNFLLHCDINRVVEYYIPTANYAMIWFSIKGWFA